MIGSANPAWNPWANDRKVLELYRRRCCQEVEEMTCAVQAAEILGGRMQPCESLLDAGCGGGYYYWSFFNREIDINYTGLDYTPEMIELARKEMCSRTNLSSDQFVLGEVGNLNREFDNILCFNVLTNNPHYALPLERLLACAKKRILLRESMGDDLIVRFTPDTYLDEGKQHIRVYHNSYPAQEVTAFMEDNGFCVKEFKDERSQGEVEMVVDIPHTWKILLAERVS